MAGEVEESYAAGDAGRSSAHSSRDETVDGRGEGWWWGTSMSFVDVDVVRSIPILRPGRDILILAADCGDDVAMMMELLICSVFPPWILRFCFCLCLWLWLSRCPCFDSYSCFSICFCFRFDFCFYSYPCSCSSALHARAASRRRHPPTPAASVSLAQTVCASHTQSPSHVHIVDTSNTPLPSLPDFPQCGVAASLLQTCAPQVPIVLLSIHLGFLLLLLRDEYACGLVVLLPRLVVAVLLLPLLSSSSPHVSLSLELLLSVDFVASAPS